MNKFKIKIFASIIFFSIISVCIIFSNSSYISKIIFESRNEIDNPIINIQTGEEVNINSVNSKTSFEDINFKINNYDGDKINTAKMNYCIQIIDNLSSDYLEYKLINNNTKEEIYLENKKTEYMDLMIGKKEDLDYTLKIKNNLPQNIEESAINIQLKLIAIQEK